MSFINHIRCSVRNRTDFVLLKVFFTLPLCGLSFILACVAIITQSWVSGRSIGAAGNADNYVDFNLGLFAGEYKLVKGGTTVNGVKSE